MAITWERSDSRFRWSPEHHDAVTFRPRVVYFVGEGRRPRTWWPGEPGRVIDKAPENLGLKTWTFSGDLLRLEMTAEMLPAGGAIAIRLSLEALSPEKVRLHRVDFVEVGRGLSLVEEPRGVRLFQSGYQSWTPTASVPADERQRYPLIRSFSLMNHDVDATPWGRRDGLLSSLVTVISPEKGGEGLLVGFTAQRVGAGSLFLKNRRGHELSAHLDYGRRHLEPGEVLEVEPLLLAWGEPNRLLEAFARQFAQDMALPGHPPPSPVGWCSWYEFYDGVTARDVRRNLDFLAENRHLPVQVFQIDDGYQKTVGDWLTFHPDFPDGLAPLAQEIRRRGFTAGLWLAPFFATRRSELFQEHRDWFLRDPRGRFVFCGYNPVWRSRLVALDLTHPEVLDWLASLFQELVDMGFDYFKLDFLFAGMREGRFARPGVSRVEAYRGALARIREVVGPHRFLLGCGAPLGPSAGFFDGMRVSEDVKEEWRNPLWALAGRGAGMPSAWGCLRNNMTRWFLHGTWWFDDPDCLLVRDHDTRLDEHEVRTLVTVLGMNGGMLFLSDDLPRLSPDRLDLAAAVLPPPQKTGRPRDVMETGFPRTFELEGEGRRLVAWVNEAATVQTRSLGEEAEDQLVFDFWKGRLLQVDPVQQALGVPSHGTVALLLTPRPREPTLVGTTLHLTALLDGRIRDRYDAARQVLLVEGEGTARGRGELWVAWTGEGRVHEEDLPPEVVDVWVHRLGVVLEVDMPPGEPFSLEIPFRDPA